jgi:hypothetical protein
MSKFRFSAVLSPQFINKTQSASKATPSKPASKAGLVADRMLGVSKLMATHLMNGLFHENNEVLLESVRVLGEAALLVHPVVIENSVLPVPSAVCDGSASIMHICYRTSGWWAVLTTLISSSIV